MKMISCSKDTSFRAQPFTGERGGLLIFRFDRKAEGILTVGKRRFAVRRGEGIADLSGLADGVYTVKFHYDGRSDELGRYEKQGDLLTDAGCSAERLNALYDRVAKAEERISGLNERISALESAIGKGLSIEL